MREASRALGEKLHWQQNLFAANENEAGHAVSMTEYC